MKNTNTRAIESLGDALQIINSRKQVQLGVTNKLKVTNVHMHTTEDGATRAIVNLNGMTPYHIAEATAQLKEGEYTKACNYNVSSGQRPSIDYVPAKGEIVNVVLELIKTDNQPDGAWLVTSLSPLATSTVGSVAISLDGVEEDVEADVAAKEAVS